jgi:large subunit ribosomal protein L25
MKSIAINGTNRIELGKSATKAARRDGRVPCVLYGGEETLHFLADERAFKNLVYTPDTKSVNLTIEKEKYSAILKDIQFHPVTDKILHADFYLLKEDKEVTLDIPVRLVGRSEGVMAGGTLLKNYRKLKVKALPKNHPDTIEVDISEMQIGDKKYVTSLTNDKYTLVHPDNTVVCQVRTSRNVIQEEAETVAASDQDASGEENKGAESEAEKPAAEQSKE